MKKAIHWFRRDLRLSDNRSLAEATLEFDEVIPVFIFDKKILDQLPEDDKRVSFIHDSITSLNEDIRDISGGSVHTFYGDPIDIIPGLAKKLKVEAVYTNEDYEKYAINRDNKISKELEKEQIIFKKFKDQIIFRGDEVLKDDFTPYRVFTPYKNKWLKTLRPDDYKKHKVSLNKLTKISKKIISLKQMSFVHSPCSFIASETAAKKQIKLFKKNIDFYQKNRDFISLDKNSKLSMYLRFGNISIREAFRTARKFESLGAQIWISELIWRDFYQMILHQFPHVESTSFNPKYKNLKWPGKQSHFKAWCEGKTGYPLIDAAMIHFNKTGEMHNRLRMIVASFLTKDLLISWKKGEKYFAEKLLDFDLASNNGGWQWSASTGCDAQPYFRVFNPITQSKKFDADTEFITSIIPALKKVPKKHRHFPSDAPPLLLAADGFLLGKDYPHPIVNHKEQREAAIKLFKEN